MLLTLDRQKEIARKLAGDHKAEDEHLLQVYWFPDTEAGDEVRVVEELDNWKFKNTSKQLDLFVFPMNKEYGQGVSLVIGDMLPAQKQTMAGPCPEWGSWQQGVPLLEELP